MVAAEWSRAIEAAAHFDTVFLKGACSEFKVISLGAVWEVAVGGSANGEDEGEDEKSEWISHAVECSFDLRLITRGGDKTQNGIDRRSLLGGTRKYAPSATVLVFGKSRNVGSKTHCILVATVSLSVVHIKWI